MRKSTAGNQQSVKPRRRPRSLPAVPASRPFVLINMAMTADGKIATANRTVSSFGSKRDLEHLYEVRATADAVMNGARTVEMNNVKMGPGGRRFRELRRRNGLSECNLRVIVSGSGSIDPNAMIFKHRFSPIIILTTQRISKRKLDRLRSLADEVIVCGDREIDFGLALRRLRKEWNICRLLCEGGAKLNSGLFDAGFVDEVHVTLCPKIAGGRTAPTIAEGGGRLDLANAKRLQLASVEQFYDELFLVYRQVSTSESLA
jgi:2,5-diamino-6-(ribosylamino)-4(3H)-pyrimidinone 5'-phosphate reductase